MTKKNQYQHITPEEIPHILKMIDEARGYCSKDTMYQEQLYISSLLHKAQDEIGYTTGERIGKFFFYLSFFPTLLK